MLWEPAGEHGDGDGVAIKPMLRAKFVNFSIYTTLKLNNQEFQFWHMSLCHGGLESSWTHLALS